MEYRQFPSPVVEVHPQNIEGVYASAASTPRCVADLVLSTLVLSSLGLRINH